MSQPPAGRPGRLCTAVLCLLPLRGVAAGQPPAPVAVHIEAPPPARPAEPAAPSPDLSHLPEVDDVTEERPQKAPRRVVPPFGTPPPMALPYLGQMLQEPEIDFVPSTPTSMAVNPYQVWEGMMVPPPPSPRELVARRLRNAGIGLLTVGTIMAVVAVPSLAARQDAPAAQGIGYSALVLSAGSFAAGGALFGVGDQRLRAARRSAAGLSWVPGGVQAGWTLLF